MSWTPSRSADGAVNLRNQLVLFARAHEFKSAFPPKETRRVSVLIKSGTKAREDILEVDVPPLQLWNDLHSDIMTATIASLPATLESINAKIEGARRQARGAVTEYRWGFAGGQSGEAQARYTIEWIDRVLAPYLAKAKR